MDRIIIVGASGSGKSTLAKKLNGKFQIPFYDLDEYYWLPNWKSRETDDFLKQIITISSHEKWIISGNYSIVREIIWTKADTVIWLDYSFKRCFYQAFKRTIERILYKQKCCNHNRETFRRAFLSTQSILWWIVKSYRRHKINYQQLFSNKHYSQIERYLHFFNPSELSEWLKHI